MKKKSASANQIELENYTHPDHFGIMLGYRVNKFDRKNHVAEVGLKIREVHLSSARRVHGGVVSAFFDFAAGAAVFSTLGPKDFCSTVELKVNYFRPLDFGDNLRAVTRVMFRGKRLCVVHGLIYRNTDKDPVAMGTATFNVVTVNAATAQAKAKSKARK